MEYYLGSVVVEKRDLLGTRMLLRDLVRRSNFSPTLFAPLSSSSPLHRSLQVVYGMQSGFWLGALRTAAAYTVFFWGRQPIVSFPSSPSKLIYDMVVGYLLYDLGFYLFHRSCHHPAVYKYLHKKHRE